MNFRRTMLRPVAWAAGRHAMRQMRAWTEAHQQTREVQDALLGEMLRRHASSAFGREHGFDRIGGYDEFVRAVPVRSYDELSPWLRRVYEGESTALLPPDEQVLMFSRTSGTTGEPKNVPVTRRFLDEMRRGWNIFGLAALRDHPRAWLRCVLQISSSMRESVSPAGVPCGAISGLLAATQKRIVRRMYAAPRQAAELRDPQDKLYTILRCAAERDVAFITTANPSSTLQLIETGQRHAERLVRDIAQGTCTPPGGEGTTPPLRLRGNRQLAARIQRGIEADGELRPGHFWSVDFLANWTGGTVGLYLPRLRALFDGAPVRDIGLLASEGRFSVPLGDGTSAGVAEICGNVLEFIPADQAGATAPIVLRPHELEVGGEYFLVVSNWTGLWRYNLDDRVRVVDRFASSPVFEFLCRGRHTANITGEKLTEHQVVAAMDGAAEGLGVRIERFELQGRFGDEPAYELRVEAGSGCSPQRLAAAMDRQLQGLNVEYASKRHSGRLGPIRPVVLSAGVLESQERERIRRTGRAEQYKPRYLLTEVLTDAAAVVGEEPGQD